MKATVRPTEKIGVLEENLRKRVKDVRKKEGKLELELEDPSKLAKIPGIESYEIDGEKKEGLKGKPVETPVYAKLESKRDAVKALIATVEGYSVQILNSGRQWDIRQLKKYNPDIKHLKFDQPRESLKIGKTISEVEGAEKVDIEIPEKQEDIEELYREMLT